MAKSKKPSQTAKADTPESKSMIPEEEASEEASPTVTTDKEAQASNEAEPTIRILFRGSCPKLTPRGVGDLEYEIGINDDADEKYLRIAKNASSGAFSTGWVGINEIRGVLETVQDQTFKAIILRDLYKQKSNNNHGFLTAILKAEGVVANLPKQLTVMRLESWEPLLEKIDSLKVTDVSLPDHIAIAAKKRAEEKARRMAEAQAARAKEKTGATDKGAASVTDA